MEEEHGKKKYFLQIWRFDNNEFYIACGFSNDRKIFWSYVDESMFKNLKFLNVQANKLFVSK